MNKNTQTTFHADQRVGIFIDTQNLYHSARSNYGAHVNYQAMIEAGLAGRKLMRAFAYVIKSEAGDESKFFEALNDMGIETRVKDLQVFYNGEKKADWDVGIAIDIVRMSEKLDTVVLVSGDGDFLEVLRYVKSRGIRAEVMAFKKTTSQKLTDEADYFWDLGAEEGKFLIRTAKVPAQRVRGVPRAGRLIARESVSMQAPKIIRPVVRKPGNIQNAPAAIRPTQRQNLDAQNRPATNSNPIQPQKPQNKSLFSRLRFPGQK